MTILLIPGTGPSASSLGYGNATSGTYSFSVNQAQIIRQMMLDIGALDGLEQPTAEEFTDCSFRLNTIVKQWMGKQDFAPGMKVWTRTRADLMLGYTKYLYHSGPTGDNWAASTTGLSYPNIVNMPVVAQAGAAIGATSIPMVSATNINVGDYFGILCGSDLFWTTATAVNLVTNVVTIPAPGLTTAAINGAQCYNYTVKAQRPLTIIAAVLRDIYYNDTPLKILTVEEYESLPTKAMPTFQSDPTAILYESRYQTQDPNGTITIDCGGAQDVTKRLHVTFLRATQDITNPGDSPDYPQQWYAPLVLELGKRCAPMFDCEWTRELEEQRVSAIATAQEADPEQSRAYFEVDNADPYGP